jgi:DNA-binding SARP family transcriptional activator
MIPSNLQFNQAISDKPKPPEILENEPGDFSWPLMICLLGEFRLLMKGEPLSTFGSGGKCATFLRLLALKHSGCMARDFLLDQLWPDASLELAAQSLNSLVYSLRKQLSPFLEGQAPVISKDGFYRLNIQAGIGVDVIAFDSLARQSDTAAQSGDPDLAAKWARRAVEYYQGDLVGGDELASTLEQERLRNVYLTLLARLADQSFREIDYSGCLQYAHRLLKYDVCREDAHRMVMRCHVRLGERAAALRQYQLCHSALSSEFSAFPEPATTDLYNLIRTNPENV